ncbi:MAG TPA: hypothetical protein VKV40_23975 [Ktedonobacteraceae bacterium]|nr:hypothetical protein [Ktedonobacteraceae bacterium]
MPYRATCVAGDPLEYFQQMSDEGPRLRVGDVILRVNHNPKEVFSRLIRFATNSVWSHSAIFYLLNDPTKGFDNIFLVEATTKGVRVASWRHEVYPFKEFTVGIKRLPLGWYAETAYEKSRHDAQDHEDNHGIFYMRHVRGMALDQVNQLYDHKVVYELSALYVERVAQKHLPDIPGVADAAEKIAALFEKWDEEGDTKQSMLRFICSGLVQYSYFEALRRRIINDLAVPENQEAALSNMSNMERILFREDPEGVFAEYVAQLRSGKLNIADPVPDEVLNLLKTATPADFNNSDKLEWKYLIREGVVWQIDEAPEGYEPRDRDEATVLAMLLPEHRSSKSSDKSDNTEQEQKQS